MNKKISTLLTFGLLVAGSLVSVANATKNVPLRIGKAAETTTFVNKKYFVIVDTDGNPQSGAEVLGMSYDGDSKTATFDGVSATLTYSASEYSVNDVDESLSEANYLWTVTEVEIGGSLYYTFVNDATKKQLFLNADKNAPLTDYSNLDGTTGNLTWTNSPAAYAGAQVLAYSGATENHGFKLSSGALTWNASQGSTFYLYQVAENEMTAKELNNLGNGSFALTYEDATVSIFDGEVKAFEVSSIDGVDAGLYLATSWGTLTGDQITKAADFQKCTFIALDSYNNWNINDLKADGEGYKFVTVSGKKLKKNASIELADMKKGLISSANAVFAITEKDPVDHSGSYTLSLKDAKFMNAKKTAEVTAENLVVAAVPDRDDLIVTAVDSKNKNYADFTDVCTLANSNLVSVDKILSTKAASVFNIQFMSTVNASSAVGADPKTQSEYNKFLGVNADGMFAQGSAFVNLDAPENQWIIVDADKKANTFTFQNRELSDQTFTVKLIAGKTANTYKVVDAGQNATEFGYAYVNKTTGAYTTVAASGIELNGTTIKLIAAEVNPMAGYVTDELDNAGLVRFVFTSDQPTIANELFVAKGATNLAVSKNSADALKWSIVKFDASADELDALVSDTIYAYNDYAYYDAAKKEVKVATAGDTIAVVAYGFKQYGKDKTYLGVNSNNLKAEENVEDVADAQRFLIKINKNGSYSLIKVGTAEIDYRSIVESSTKAYTVDNSGNIENGTGTSIYYDYTAAHVYDFSIVKDEATPSLKHEPGYVTLNADNKGYVAMDSVTYESIVAPVSLLKSAYTSEDLTFRLDTADSEAFVPSFYISHIGKFMYNAKDSADYYNDGTASAEGNKLYKLVDGNAKAIFRAATLLASDTLATTVNDKEVKVMAEANKSILGGLNNFKYQIVQKTADSEGEYVIKSVADGYYLYNLNGFLGFTDNSDKALVVLVEASEAPVANEAVSTSSVKVATTNGAVVISGAAGKTVTISNLLGQPVASTVITSSEATISVPAGVVIVAVEGEKAVKAIVR